MQPRNHLSNVYRSNASRKNNKAKQSLKKPRTNILCTRLDKTINGKAYGGNFLVRLYIRNNNVKTTKYSIKCMNCMLYILPVGRIVRSS